MDYRDRVYGKIKIEEPVILDLINSPYLKRLSGIDQGGYFLYFWDKKAETYEVFSRFDHSLGVYILLGKFGASFEEQISGLIHDVSHGVFSHCIDYVLDEGSEKEQNHQDNIFKEFVLDSDIPKILKKHNLDPEYILNEHKFPLLERKLPDLCADRIDYALRTAIVFGDIDQSKVDYFLENLKVENNSWVFKNLKPAKDFAELFSKLNKDYFAGFYSAVMFRTVGDLLKYALGKSYISKDDLYTTDKNVLAKIRKNLGSDEKLRLLFDRMNNKIRFENNPKDYNAHVFCKSRVIDPLFLIDNKIKRISEIDKDWQKFVKEESEPKEYRIKFYD